MDELWRLLMKNNVMAYLSLVVVWSALFLTTQAQGATFTVNATGDTFDMNPGDGICATSFGNCTLRAALEEANTTTATDTIAFSISGAGVKTISPNSSLPDVTEPLIIDGWSQGGAGYTGPPLIELNGVNTLSSDGLTITAGNTIVRGLAINRFSINGISLRDRGDNIIEGCYIGTDSTGSANQGNISGGVVIATSSNNTIGGVDSTKRNIISGNSSGIFILGLSNNNTIKGNYIGTDVTGTFDLGNSFYGIRLFSINSIGAPLIVESNIIAFNGIGVFMEGATGNSVRGNSIFSNDDLGIDIAPIGVTPNDLGDADTGPNNLQNFPVLTSTSNSGGDTTIEGTLNSTANTSFDIDFYSSNLCDASGNGEGRNYRGSTLVTTDASGNTSFTFTSSILVPLGNFVTATATRSSAPFDTSEFSTCFEVLAPYVVTNTNDSGAGSLRQAILDANATFGFSQITFDIPGAGVRTINLFSVLPIITEPVIIDGTTQPGFASTPLIELNGAGAGAGADGLNITAGNSTVKSLAINLFSGDGIELATGGSNIVEGCHIGTNTDGTADLGNGQNGLRIASSSNNFIGGLTSTGRNVISGNQLDGIFIAGLLSTGNQIKGNYIGTDITGTLDLGNTDDGIEINNQPSNNFIGGATPAERNLISGNNDDGLFISGTGSDGNQVKGNFIGVDASGTADIGNTGDGIEIALESDDNIIGGANTGEDNRIGFNLRGIYVSSTSSTGNSIRGNIISLNDNLGIDLGTIGITANDAGDADTGANNLQNFPMLTSAINQSGSLTIQGSLASTANTPFTVDFYSNSLCDASGHGEGQTPIGSIAVATNASGNAAYSFTAAVPVGAGNFVTSTATRDSVSLDTSEFSACIQVANALIVSNTSDSGVGSLRQAILDANASAGHSQIVFNIPGAGVQTINLNSALPAITESLEIDGATQPGFTGTPLIELNGAGAGNNADGLRIFAGNSTVRSLTINRYEGDGIELNTGGGNRIEGCFIGTDATGTADLGNGGDGIRIIQSFDNFIGGPTAARRNLISGNLFDGIFIIGVAAAGNQVKGNLIGTDVTGTIDLGNSRNGIEITVGSANNIIGGSIPAERNLISANNRSGILIQSSGSINNQIIGNFIGTDINGTADLGNDDTGIEVGSDGANTIGGVNPGDGNRIAFNGIGVRVSATLSVGNSIRGNAIFSNDTLGIDLEALGVTNNDAGDADTGANNLQNFPVILSASIGSTTVQGTFSSIPNTVFTLDFYSSQTADSSNHGEGENYLGSASVTTNAAGSASFFVAFPQNTPIGQFITATATDPAGNTSEFSEARPILAPTAASASISGRIKTSDGRGISKARLVLANASTGEVSHAVSSSFGYYRFNDLPVGETYILTISSKRFSFKPNTRVIALLDELTDEDFEALPLN